jgi:hypothetical protein
MEHEIDKALASLKNRGIDVSSAVRLSIRFGARFGAHPFNFASQFVAAPHR